MHANLYFLYYGLASPKSCIRNTDPSFLFRGMVLFFFSGGGGEDGEGGLSHANFIEVSLSR